MNDSHPPTAPSVKRGGGRPLSQAPLHVGIGGTVRGLRQERRLPIRRLATQTGLSAGFLSNVENGICEPGWRALGLLATAFGMRLSEMVRRQEDRHPQPGA